MSEKRFSLWHVVGLLALVMMTGAVTLGAGAFLGYQWGHARGVADAPRQPLSFAPEGGGALPFSAIPRGGASGPYLGVRFEPVTPELAQAENLSVESGALIREVMANSPAASAGLKVGDIVQQVNGQTVDATHTLRDRVAAFQPQAEIALTVLRDGKAVEVKVTLGEQLAAPHGEMFPGWGPEQNAPQTPPNN